MATIELKAPYDIKVVNINIHNDDLGRITSLDLKFKVNDSRINNHIASTVIFSALNVTTFVSDGGSRSLNFGQDSNLSQNVRRKDLIYNIQIKVNPSDSLSFTDVGKFVDFLQKEITFCQIPFVIEDPADCHTPFTE